MENVASRSLKFAYALTMLAMVSPFGIASSGWVTAATGGRFGLGIPFIGPVIMLALGLYRVYLVARVPGTLDSPEPQGVSGVLRKLGLIGIYAGALTGVLNLLAQPMMYFLIRQPSESGVEYFVVGMYLAMLSGIGTLGIVLFEFSRLLAFERHAIKHS